MAESILIREFQIGRSILQRQRSGDTSWEKTGKIWYVTLRDRLRENSDFQDASYFTFDVAGGLIVGRKNSKEQEAVPWAWNEVGTKISPKK